MEHCGWDVHCGCDAFRSALRAASTRFASWEAASRPAFVRATRTRRLAGATNSVSHRIERSTALLNNIALRGAPTRAPTETISQQSRAERITSGHTCIRQSALSAQRRHPASETSSCRTRSTSPVSTHKQQNARAQAHESVKSGSDGRYRFPDSHSILPIALTRVPLERAPRAHPVRIERPLPPSASVSVFVLCTSSNSLPKAISSSYSIAESSVHPCDRLAFSVVTRTSTVISHHFPRYWRIPDQFGRSTVHSCIWHRSLEEAPLISRVGVVKY